MQKGVVVMTDREIIKALGGCLAGGEDDCLLCPLHGVEQCTYEKDCAVADLINRQKEEIERLKKELTEIQLSKEMYRFTVGEIRAEAIKEFAERLKQTFPSREDPRCTDDDIYTLNIIDNLVEEMTEEKK